MSTRSIGGDSRNSRTATSNRWKGRDTFNTELQGLNVEERIQTLSLALNAFQESINAELTKMRRERNDSLRIHRLPYELFLTIISFAVDSQPRPRRHETLTRLSHVSFHWYDFISTTPSLWTVVQLSDPPSYRQMSLKRSQQYGLTIRCEKGGPIYLTDESAVLQFFRDLRPSLYRWRKVIIHSGTFLRSHLMHRILETPAPRLEYLSLEHGALLEPQRTYTLFGGAAACLKEIHLDRVPIRWGPELSAIWDGLLVIDASFYNVVQPPMQDLRQALASCTLLKKLRLAYLDPETAVVSEDRERVLLPNLQQIELLRSSTPALVSILSLLMAPTCTTLHLTPPRERDEEWFNEELIAALSPLATSMPARLFEGCKVTIWLNNIIIFDHRRRALDVGFFDSSPRCSPKPLHWILSNFKKGLLRRPVYLRLGEGVDLEDEELSAAIGSLKSISSINVLSGVVGTDALITCLSTALGDGNCWPLPDLLQLIVEVPVDSNQVVQMARNRYDARESAMDEEQEGTPLRFELLQFAHLQSEAQQQLRTIVGDDCEVIRKTIGEAGSVEDEQAEEQTEAATDG